jgi:hypothetical protein
MAVEVTVSNIPELITLSDGTEHTIIIDSAPQQPYNVDLLYIEVVSASSTVKFNNSGDATDSSATWATGDKFFLSVSPDYKLRILGSTSDTIKITL